MHRLGDVTGSTGLTARQIREWERRGLVAPARGSGNQRTFSDADIERLVRARRMRDAGLRLDQIRLVLGIDSGALGSDVSALDQVREILGMIVQQSQVADELTSAVREQLTRRRGNHART